MKPLRAEVVGSFLRPESLVAAKQRWATSSQDTEEACRLKRAEDYAVKQVIDMQEWVGMRVVTDGELRRSLFWSPLLEWKGYSSGQPAEITLHSDTGITQRFSLPVVVTDRIQQTRLQLPEEYIYSRASTAHPIKVTVPSPLLMAFLWDPDRSPKVYPDPFDLFKEAAVFLRNEIKELTRLGCTYIQIDAPELLHVFIDEEQRDCWRSIGIDPARVTSEGVEIINWLAEPIPGVTFALHVCRGNGTSMWIAQGGYEPASEIFTRATNYHRFLLEYDDTRSGGFEPLERIPEDKVIVLVSHNSIFFT